MNASGLVALLAGLTLSCGVMVARAQVDSEYFKAVTTMYVVAKLGGFVKDWCDLRAPQTKAVTSTGLANWRKTFKLEGRLKALAGGKIAQIDTALEDQRQAMYTRLDGDSKDPAKDCLAIERYLNAQVNPLKLYPQEYQLALRPPAPTSPPTPTSPAAPAPAAPPTGVAAARGGVYTVAQLGVILEKARAAKQSDESALRALGSFFVMGTLERYDLANKDATVFLNTLRDGFRSRVSATCYGYSFQKLYEAGTRGITLRATFYQMNGSDIVKLTDCAVVGNTAGLQPVKLEDKSALYRSLVNPERVMTKPNAGLKPAETDGLYWHGEVKYGYDGSSWGPNWKEDTYLLMKDGWIYKNLRFPPADLNVAESKRLEPQHWAQFKRQGKQLVVQWRDDYGQVTGKPQVLKAELIPPLKRGATLNGVFTISSTYTSGNSSDGVSRSSTDSYTFTPNGRYVFTGFSMTTASSSLNTGLSGQVGGTSLGSNGTVSSNVGGGDDEGTYAFDGYTLELRSKSGAVTRVFAFLWDDQQNSQLVINGTTYSVLGKK